MLRLSHPLLVLAVVSAAACHPGPVLTPKANVGGTIAGIVSTDGDAPVPGRKVTAIDVATGMRYDATTGTNGGYTIKVPEGTYRLELELRSGETVVKHPSDTRIQKSDLDPRRDFTISVKSRGGADSATRPASRR